MRNKILIESSIHIFDTPCIWKKKNLRDERILLKLTNFIEDYQDIFPANSTNADWPELPKTSS